LSHTLIGKRRKKKAKLIDKVEKLFPFAVSSINNIRRKETKSNKYTNQTLKKAISSSVICTYMNEE